LLQAIRNRKEGKPITAVDHVVEHTLVTRDSVAPPRKP
jgi:hypothetical protein